MGYMSIWPISNQQYIKSEKIISSTRALQLDGVVNKEGAK